MKTSVGVRGRMATAGVKVGLAPGPANRARVEGEGDPGPWAAFTRFLWLTVNGHVNTERNSVHSCYENNQFQIDTLSGNDGWDIWSLLVIYTEHNKFDTCIKFSNK